jgi:hypothetical protein
MYMVNGFKANVSERDLRLLCVLMKTIRDWPNKSRAIFECLENSGGLLLISKPQKCLDKLDETDFCQRCKNCTARDRENVHEFLETLYDVGQSKSETRGLPLNLVKFVSAHGCELLKVHKRAKRPKKPLF